MKMTGPKITVGAVPRAGGVKPALRMRHIKLAGRSAFPQQPAAFGPPDPASGPAFGAGVPTAAAAGDTGE